MKRALVLIALALSYNVALAQSTAKPDTRSDHLRTESVKAPESKPAASTLRLNLNKASAAELMKLPGVDAATAKAIIKGRPYRSKDEVLQKRILKPEAYEELKGNLYAGM